MRLLLLVDDGLNELKVIFIGTLEASEVFFVYGFLELRMKAPIFVNLVESLHNELDVI